MTFKLTLKRKVATFLQSTGALSAFANGEWRILMYHRVVAPESVPYPIQPGMYVRPETFRMQMEYLAQTANVLPLDQLVSILNSGEELPPRAVSITFDDGWRDNYQNAFPVLKTLNLPATMFVATGFIETTNIFWTDLAGLFVRYLSTPSGLNDSSDRLRKPFDLGNKGEFLEVVTQARTLPPPEGVDFLVRYIGAQERKTRLVLLSFMRSAIPDDLIALVKDSFCTWSQLREMSQSGITLGSHTHNHETLSELKPEAMKVEIETSRRKLKENCGSYTKIFCYPGGYYNELTSALLLLSNAPAALTVEKSSDFSNKPPHLGRTGIHQDISDTEAMFAARIWCNRYF